MRILSLDGGGSWALLQVMALQQIYGARAGGHEVLADFDLVAANSGGSITLGGLFENRTLDDLLDNFFLQAAQRRQVFVRASFVEAPVAAFLRFAGVGAAYSTSAKLRGLQALFRNSGALRLSQLRDIPTLGGRCPDVLICGFDYDRTRGFLFRSNPDSRARNGEGFIDPTLAQAVHASSTAPVLYFDAPAQLRDRQFWDGGVAGYNNPALLAVVEALANGADREAIRVLSIGTGTVFLPFDPRSKLPPTLVQGRRESTSVGDLRELATAIVDDPPDIASFHAHVALGGALPDAPAWPLASPVVRLNPLIAPVPDGQGGWTNPSDLPMASFAGLQQLPMDAVERVDLIVELGKSWLAGNTANQPVRINRETLGCEIGYPTFAAGVAAWRAVPARTAPPAPPPAGVAAPPPASAAADPERA